MDSRLINFVSWWVVANSRSISATRPTVNSSGSIATRIRDSRGGSWAAWRRSVEGAHLAISRRNFGNGIVRVEAALKRG